MDLVELFSHLICRFKMNDNAPSTIVINSGGSPNGTAQRNTNLLHVDGKINGALAFNGTSDYIDCNNTYEPTFKDSFSITGWFRFSANDSDLILFNAYDNNVTNYQVQCYYDWVAPEIGCIYTSQSQTLGTPFATTPTLNTWYMITMIVTKTSSTTAKMYFYINSELKAEDEGSINMADFANRYDFLLGAEALNGGVPYNFFSGLIDNVMIFNKALTQEEITYLYNGGDGIEIPPPLSGEISVVPSLSGEVEIIPSLDGEMELIPLLTGEVELEPALDGELELVPSLAGMVVITEEE
jgi:hypothetical protein